MALVVLAMSGGVDSSVAAQLLKKDGHEIVGVFMRHGAESPLACSVTDDSKPSTDLPIIEPPVLASQATRLDHKQGCCSATDAEDARQVAERLDIPFYALNLQQEFDRIIDYFVDEYLVGRTPNPCVMCNNWIKFGKLFAYADSIGASHVATGHYARLSQVDGEFQLRRGLDQSKDQSYVLFGIGKPLLSRMMLPVGSFQKPEIRERAAEVGLRVADKRDSQEICFVTSGQHADFVAKRGGKDTAGDIVTTDGKVVGKHDGIEGFTIGQRRGLGVAMGEPFFVVRIDSHENAVVIGRHEELGTRRLIADQVNWIADPREPGDSFRCEVQFRYNSTSVPATVTMQDGNRFEAVFDEPGFGVAPGQAAVCYSGDRVLGGGWIESTGDQVS